MKKNIIDIIGLKNIIMIVFLICVFFPGIGFILYNNSSEALLQNIRQSLENRALDSSGMLEDIFKDKITSLKLIAENHDIKSMDWNRQKEELLSHIDTLKVKRCRIINKDGQSISTDGYATDVSDREYFKKAIKGDSNISDVLISRADGSKLVICATPIINQSKIVGALSYGIEYQVLSHLITSIKIGENGYTLLINNEGATVVHPEAGCDFSNVSIFESAKSDPSLIELAKLEKRMIKGEIGSGFFKQNNLKKFMAFAPVYGTQWYIALVVPEKEVFSLLISLKTKFIIVTISFIILAFSMLYLVLVYLSQIKKVHDLQKNADDNYRQMIEVTELDRLKTEFFSNLSHELRTPLNVILSTLQLFEQYIKGDIIQNKQKITKHTLAMKQNCFRLLRLINNLLDITRIDSGFFELRLQHIDIIKYIRDLMQSVHEYASNNGLSLEFTAELEEKFINCDIEKIERIMLNLLSNAIKFTSKGGSISVNVSTTLNNVIISVKDTGIGIPEDKQTVIFERFRQVERSFTRNYEGSGIGLSLVKSLIEMHKGKISIKSEIGVGSEFIVELPSNLDIGNYPIDELSTNQLINGQYTGKVKIELSELNRK